MERPKGFVAQAWAQVQVILAERDVKTLAQLLQAEDDLLKVPYFGKKGFKTLVSYFLGRGL